MEDNGDKKSQDKGEKKVSRRDFIRKSAEVGAGVAAASAGIGALSALTGCATFKDGARFTASDDEFEYIVVGSGAGGAPVAANLAKAGYSVLLLEAGGKDYPLSAKVPAMHAKASEDPAIAWNYYVKHYSDPQRQAQDSKYVPGKGILYPRGGTVGGSTMMNAMITLYPDSNTWDEIRKSTGDESWNADAMRGYFERLELAHYVNPLDSVPGARRGFKGWLMTEQSDIGIALKDKKILETIIAAAREQGAARELIEKLMRQDFNLRWDPNDWQAVRKLADGLYNIPKATNHGRRNGTRELVMNTLQRYPQHLTLRTDAVATQVIFDESSGKKNRAIGIEYLEGSRLYRADPNASSSSGVKRRVFARREVILAGGAFNSPQLLMLSGIGPREQLERHRIPVRIPTPGVGRNLQDRYEVGVISQMRTPFDVIGECTFGEAGDPEMAKYEADPMKHVYGTNGVVMSIIKRSSPDKARPDLVLFGIPGHFGGYAPGYSKNAYPRDQFTWAVLKGHTRNTAGTVDLRSANPLDPPDVNFRYFDEGNDAAGEDLEAVLEGVKFARKINSDLVIRSKIQQELSPGKPQSDDELREHIKKEAWGHHASCSNKMGPSGDVMSVVDSKFRVHGTEGLRVVDASIFPRIPGLFIVTPIYMIAEKASDEILATAKQSAARSATRPTVRV